jgi:hypothetical protein
MEQVHDFTGARWFKSTHSDAGGCVEVAMLPTVVGIRDSKTKDSPVIVVPREAWKQFVADVQAGEYEV